MLNHLQRSLETVYRLEPAPQISDFLIPTKISQREQLYVVEEEDLFLGLAMAPAAISTLNDPRLEVENLDSFCLAVEGVSHFLYLVHKAQNGHPVTQLELELQAEIDKFVAAFVMVKRCSTLAENILRQRLFTNCRFVEDLPIHELKRYYQANTLARRYTSRLARLFIHTYRLPAMIRELRLFYRMSFAGKRSLIG